MKAVVDRIENDFAVVELEDGKFINIPLSELPIEVKEGSVIEFLDNDKYRILEDEEKERRKQNFNALNSLFKN